MKCSLLVFSCWILVAVPGFCLPSFQVDKAVVSVQKRPDRDWLFLDSEASGFTSVPIDSLVTAIEAYQTYPALLPRIKEVKVEETDGGTLVTSKIVISAIGIVDVNVYTLKYVLTEVSASPRVVKVDFTQVWTDGSIDSLAGGWVLEDQGTAGVPRVHATYWSQSAIPSYALGEKEFIQLFLGSETKNWMDLIVKSAGS